MDGVAVELPAGYYLERDSGVPILRRSDGSVVVELDDRRPRAAGSSLRVRFFGRFELLRGGGVVCLGRNARALAILKYLLARRGGPVSRDRLMGWLWSESDIQRARWSLNSAVHALRGVLGERLPEADLSCGGGEYRLTMTHWPRSDTEEFDAHCERGRRLEEAGRVPEAVAEYEEAVGLYRDDYLIEDLYEDWTAIERERLANLYVDALGRTAAHQIRTGRLQESVRTCYEILKKDRCHEDGHYLLMECYARLGLRSRALRQYRLCEQALRQEYAIEPSPRIRALHGNIRRDGSAWGKPA